MPSLDGVVSSALAGREPVNRYGPQLSVVTVPEAGTRVNPACDQNGNPVVVVEHLAIHRGLAPTGLSFGGRDLDGRRGRGQTTGPDRLLTVEEVAERMGVTPRRV